MAVARADRCGYGRASTGACANELSTRAGEKGVHEWGNDCGVESFGSLLAGGAGGGAGRRKVTQGPQAEESTRVWENN